MAVVQFHLNPRIPLSFKTVNQSALTFGGGDGGRFGRPLGGGNGDIRPRPRPGGGGDPIGCPPGDLRRNSGGDGRRIGLGGGGLRSGGGDGDGRRRIGGGEGETGTRRLRSGEGLRRWRIIGERDRLRLRRPGGPPPPPLPYLPGGGRWGPASESELLASSSMYIFLKPV